MTEVQVPVGYDHVRPLATGDDPELDPFEIEFRDQFRHGRGPRGPFVNSQGVVIGDHQYASPNSPLERWDVDTDPAVMSGDEWVHPFKDVGFHTEENREYFAQGRWSSAQGGTFMHPDKDVAYESYLRKADEAPGGTETSREAADGPAGGRGGERETGETG